MNAHIEKILQEVGKVIVGKEATLEKILMTVLSRGHVLLDDVPGTGKTTTVLWVCNTAASSSRRTCCPRTSWVSPCTARRAVPSSTSPAR